MRNGDNSNLIGGTLYFMPRKAEKRLGLSKLFSYFISKLIRFNKMLLQETKKMLKQKFGHIVIKMACLLRQ